VRALLSPVGYETSRTDLCGVRPNEIGSGQCVQKEGDIKGQLYCTQGRN